MPNTTSLYLTNSFIKAHTLYCTVDTPNSIQVITQSKRRHIWKCRKCNVEQVSLQVEVGSRLQGEADSKEALDIKQKVQPVAQVQKKLVGAPEYAAHLVPRVRVGPDNLLMKLKNRNCSTVQYLLNCQIYSWEIAHSHFQKRSVNRD